METVGRDGLTMLPVTLTAASQLLRFLGQRDGYMLFLSPFAISQHLQSRVHQLPAENGAVQNRN